MLWSCGINCFCKLRCGSDIFVRVICEKHKLQSNKTKHSTEQLSPISFPLLFHWNEMLCHEKKTRVYQISFWIQKHGCFCVFFLLFFCWEIHRFNRVQFLLPHEFACQFWCWGGRTLLMLFCATCFCYNWYCTLNTDKTCSVSMLLFVLFHTVFVVFCCMSACGLAKHSD